jgi:hypothetical protein
MRLEKFRMQNNSYDATPTNDILRKTKIWIEKLRGGNVWKHSCKCLET